MSAKLGLGRRLAFVFFLCILALALRWPALETRPFHTDEAVNAYLVEEVLRTGIYHYRAHDHHGPTLFYLIASGLHLGGVENMAEMEAWMLRAVPLLASLILIVSVGMAHRWLDWSTRWVVMGYLAMAAPFVYYGTQAIHELLLVGFFWGWLLSFWQWRESMNLLWALLAGLWAGLMLSTKETAAPILGLSSLALLWGSRGLWRQCWSGLAVQVGVAGAIVLLFFSGFGREPNQAFALLSAVGKQVGRGLGAAHPHPWWTYLQWSLLPSPVGWPWSSWVMVIGASLAVALRLKTVWIWPCLRVFFVLFLFFSFMPYKTPWLQLVIWLPLLLVAATGWVECGRRSPRLVALAAVVASGLMWSETIIRCHQQAVNPANPLAYAPSSPDVERLRRDVLKLMPHHSETVQVVARDYWPLPWVLRREASVGFWSAPPQVLSSGPVIAGPEVVGALSSRSDWQSYELRPGVFIFLSILPRP